MLASFPRPLLRTFISHQSPGRGGSGEDNCSACVTNLIDSNYIENNATDIDTNEFLMFFHEPEMTSG